MVNLFRLPQKNLIKYLAIFVLIAIIITTIVILHRKNSEGFTSTSSPSSSSIIVGEGNANGLANIGQYVTGNAEVRREVTLDDQNPFFNFAQQCNSNPSCSACNGVCESTGQFVGVLEGNVVTGSCSGRILEGDDCDFYVEKKKCEAITTPDVATPRCGVCVDVEQLRRDRLVTKGVLLNSSGQLAYPQREQCTGWRITNKDQFERLMIEGDFRNPCRLRPTGRGTEERISQECFDSLYAELGGTPQGFYSRNMTEFRRKYFVSGKTRNEIRDTIRAAETSDNYLINFRNADYARNPCQMIFENANTRVSDSAMDRCREQIYSGQFNADNTIVRNMRMNVVNTSNEDVVRTVWRNLSQRL